MANTPDVGWSLLVFSNSWLQKLEHIANKPFGPPIIADEAVNYAINLLPKEEWQRLPPFRNNSHPFRYLNTVAGYLLEGFFRQKFRRPLPPAWMKRNGSIWIGTWQQPYPEKQPEQSAIDKLTDQIRTPSFIKVTLKTIKTEIPWRRVKHEEVPSSYLTNNNDEVDYFDILTSPDGSSQSNKNIECLMLTIRHFIEGKGQAICNLDASAEVGSKLIQAINSIELRSEELLTLRLIYLEGLTQKNVAETLTIPEYQLSRNVKSTLPKIRPALPDSKAQTTWRGKATSSSPKDIEQRWLESGIKNNLNTLGDHFIITDLPEYKLTSSLLPAKNGHYSTLKVISELSTLIYFMCNTDNHLQLYGEVINILAELPQVNSQFSHPIARERNNVTTDQ